MPAYLSALSRRGGDRPSAICFACARLGVLACFQLLHFRHEPWETRGLWTGTLFPPPFLCSAPPRDPHPRMLDAGAFLSTQGSPCFQTLMPVSSSFQVPSPFSTTWIVTTPPSVTWVTVS